ncbi:MAG: TonB-dependent receptor [Candidatus Thiodiazotropha sp.]|nr:TonB-dependent receptor [Candidatus Thiodiazotropha sp.]MCM8883879.1 TonB-dependent receptor [Candidatus Thiodiazotropha sp.]MCM8919795.1 TonB-dependent receptor [Candidatus Thiodiazotropha sp.]
MHKRYLNLWLLLSVLLFTNLQVTAGTTNESEELNRLKHLSLDDLLEVTVTSVSRKAQTLSDAASAIYVITQEDIRRSGMTQIPELLRMVPGMHVAQIDANKWAISARGFNGRYANKLLVLMDGRSLYTPLYSGVYWDVQDTVLEDVERIEVIRGPGATLWGSNAVNGIINIITKSTHGTEGGLISLADGSEEKALGTLRYSGKTTTDNTYRIYAKRFQRDDAIFFDGINAGDDWQGERLGFRIDSKLSEIDNLTLQGDLYNGMAGQNNFTPFPPPSGSINRDEADTSGGNLLTRWTHRLSQESSLNLQFYYDRTHRKNTTLTEHRNTYDLDFQHDFLLNERHAIVWGAGYRSTRDKIHTPETSALRFSHQKNRDRIVSAFVQDDITLLPDRLHMILGSKYEHNDYTGNEFQPSLRVIWTPDNSNSFWGAISRAVRTPSRIETDVNIRVGPISVSGNEAFDTEKLLAYELGYRTQATSNLSLDIAAFYNEYDDLSTFELIGPPSPGNIQIGLDNLMSGESYGLELVANWEVSARWRIKASHAWLKVNLETDSSSSDTASTESADITPEHQTQLRSQLDLPYDLEFDTSIYYVDEIPNSVIDGYTRLDMRLGWKPVNNLELSLALQNLLDDEHPEFIEFSGFSGPVGLKSTQVERSALLQLKWKF